jgi:hypothetical protein
MHYESDTNAHVAFVLFLHSSMLEPLEVQLELALHVHQSIRKGRSTRLTCEA